MSPKHMKMPDKSLDELSLALPFTITPAEWLTDTSVPLESISLERGGSFRVDHSKNPLSGNIGYAAERVLALSALALTNAQIAEVTPYSARTVVRRADNMQARLPASTPPHAIHRSFEIDLLVTVDPVPGLPELSPRQYQYLLGAASGLNEGLIAEGLDISENTVHRHGDELRKKFDVPNNDACVLLGHLDGRLPPDTTRRRARGREY